MIDCRQIMALRSGDTLQDVVKLTTICPDDAPYELFLRSAVNMKMHSPRLAKIARRIRIRYHTSRKNGRPI